MHLAPGWSGGCCVTRGVARGCGRHRQPRVLAKRPTTDAAAGGGRHLSATDERHVPLLAITPAMCIHTLQRRAVRRLAHLLDIMLASLTIQG